MFNTLTKPQGPTLQEQIDTTLLEMKSHSSDSDEFDTLLNQLERLYKLQTTEKSDKVSKDTLLIVGGNLLGIMMILNFERLNVVTSKALSFVLKSKI